MLIEDHSVIAEDKFGAGSTVDVVRNLQAQCDIHASKILDLFVEQYRVMQIVDEVTRRSRGEGPALDPREFASVLEEIALMSEAAEIYDHYTRKKSKTALDNLAKTDPTAATKKAKTPDGLLHVSELNRKIQELIGYYILLEEQFMIESVKKV